MLRRLRIDFEVGPLVPDPPAGRFVPPDLPTLRVPRLAGWIARRTVVEDASIRRPGPRPVRIDAESRRIFGPAPRHLVARFGPRSAVQPGAAQRRPVVFQPREAGTLLAGLRWLGGRLGDFGECLTVDVAR